jgi:hypothetical protein
MTGTDPCLEASHAAQSSCSAVLGTLQVAQAHHKGSTRRSADSWLVGNLGPERRTSVLEGTRAEERGTEHRLMMASARHAF